MLYFFAVIGYVLMPILVGWTIAFGKTEHPQAFSISMLIYGLLVVFSLVGVLIKYKWW